MSIRQGYVRHVAARAALLAGAAIFIPFVASAQTATGADSGAGQPDIVVTASRIARSPIAAQPTEALTGVQLAKRGYTNLGSALQELPVFATPANSPAGSQGSFGAGQTLVNMYNLGSQRTLTLVNGTRFVSSASSSLFGVVAGSPVDFSALPVNLVDRIETVSVGGAPIYGSDAIAGTVNVILKRDYQGVSMTAQTGLSQKGDGANYNASLLAGRNFSDNRGNVTLSVQYDKQDGIPTSNRFYTSADGPFNATAARGLPYRQALYFGGQRYSIFNTTGMPVSRMTCRSCGASRSRRSRTRRAVRSSSMRAGV